MPRLGCEAANSLNHFDEAATGVKPWRWRWHEQCLALGKDWIQYYGCKPGVHLWNTMDPFDTWRVRTFSKLYCSGNYPWRSSKRAKPSVFQRQSAAKLKTNPGNPCNKLTASETRSISSTMITLDGFNDASEMIFTCYWWVCSRNVRVLMTKTR